MHKRSFKLSNVTNLWTLVDLLDLCTWLEFVRNSADLDDSLYMCFRCCSAFFAPRCARARLAAFRARSLVHA